jgi:ADP-heptose:LPS heptosyltransferase
MQVLFLFVLVFAKVFKTARFALEKELKENVNLLIIRPGGLGDGMMTIPFLKAIRKELPKAHVTLMCVKKNCAAFKHVQLCDELMVIDNLRHLVNNYSVIRKTEYDVVFDLEPFRKISSIISFFTGANTRIGFDTNNRRNLYTHFVTYNNEKSFETVNIMRQLEAVNIHVSEKDSADMSFEIPRVVHKNVEKKLESRGIDLRVDVVVAVAPGVLKPHHRWVMSRFAELIEMILSQDPGTKIILLGIRSDLADAKGVLHYLKDLDRVVNLVGETAFSEVLAVLSFCNVLIACDGGIVYMAAAMGCKTISIWGPGVMERFKPPGPDHIGIRKNYFCIPCVNYNRLGEFPPCPYNRRCYNDITAQEVFEKYRRI